MGSELHAGSLAMHWFLVLNFKNISKVYQHESELILPRNSNGLGYSNPSEDQSSFPCAAANALLPPRAQSRAVPLGSRTVPTAHGRSEPSLLARQQSLQHLHLRYLHSSGAKPWGRSQTQGQNERCMERHQAETRMVSISLTKMLTERQWLATKPGHMPQQLCSLLAWADLTWQLKSFY